MCFFIITSLTLGIIAASSAALIGLTNLATRNKIAQNEIDKVNAGIAEIFGKTASISQESNISGYKYTTRSYQVEGLENGNGIAYRTDGSNEYGKISLLVGFSYGTGETSSFVGLYIVKDEQTYASTLEDKYITPLNEGKRELDDVKCDATYGARLVRNMVSEAKEIADNYVKGLLNE